jgi:uncharacterized protein (UPF0548 family)
VFRLFRPSAAERDAFVAAQAGASVSTPHVGATRGPAPPGYVVDHNRQRLGSGADAFARAVDALRGWRMTDLGWVTVHPAGAPVAAGTVVAVVARHLGFWSMHPCRIVDTFDDEADGVRRFGFAYATLPAHAEVGEERFAVEWRRADDSVWYDLYAVSRPAHPLARLGYPVVRRLQRRFGRDSKRAMAAAVGGATR